jgi:hypothetical protein
LRLCPVGDDGWEIGDGDKALADAPAYDCTSAIAGQRSETGDRWTFDLATADDPVRPAGFAIVPDATAPSPTFQVVLLRTPPEEEDEP